MSGKSKLWILGVGAVLVTIAVIYAMNPLARSDEVLRDWLLSRVPVGSEIERLHQVASQEDWEVWGSWKRGEYAGWKGIDGDTVVRVHLGGYSGPFWTEVSAYWAFDASGRLIDVETVRSVDAP